MPPTAHVLRDDDRYLVIVGWDYDLQTFYAYVHDRSNDSSEADPVVSIGGEPHEIPTISSLITVVSRFAPMPPATISTLRHEARPLSDSLPYDELPEAG